MATARAPLFLSAQFVLTSTDPMGVTQASGAQDALPWGPRGDVTIRKTVKCLVNKCSESSYIRIRRFTLANLRSHHQLDLAELRLTTKATLEGIPEWRALHSVCSSLAQICRGPDGTYASIERQLILKGASSRDKHGLRLSKSILRSRLRRLTAKPSMVTKKTKRKSANIHELRRRVVAAGGNPRPRVNNARKAWDLTRIKRWLSARGLSTV